MYKCRYHTMLNVCVQHMICTVTGTFEYINLPDDIILVSLFKCHSWWVGCVTDRSLASAFYPYSVFFYYWLLWCSLEPSLYAAHNAEVLVLVNKSFYCNCLLCFSEFLMGPNFVCILMICLLGESLIGVG